MIDEEDDALLLPDLHPDTEYTMAIRSQHAYPGNLRKWGEWSPTVGFITRPGVRAHVHTLCCDHMSVRNEYMKYMKYEYEYEI